MRNLAFLFFLGVIISLSSCRKDFEFEPSQGGLTFSRDTVYLDTVFTNIGSSTYTLKVYNNSDRDIVIPSIKLGKADSKYRMMVDGMTGNDGIGKFFPNVELLAKDSLFIFIETTANIADADPTDFLYTDQIEFGNGANLQSVDLVTLIQDAVFLYPQRFIDGTTEELLLGSGETQDTISGFFLDHNENNDEYRFTATKPYVIYGYAAVAPNETLNIDPGARIHFHAESGIIVASGGKIIANGGISSDRVAMENEIVFEGDRLEPIFSDVPGQWGAIWLTPGSGASEFNHVTIKNAVIGLYIQNNAETVSIKNTQIYDCSNFGIYAQTATVTGENVVINSAGQVALACSLGGSYEFKQSTFNNNWPSSRQLAVLVDNFLVNDGIVTSYDLRKAQFSNCIIFGSNQIELGLNRATTGLWENVNFTKCMIKFNASADVFTEFPIYNFINDPSQIKKNGNPDFWDIPNNKLQIGTASDAIGFGDPAVAAEVPIDLDNVNRSIAPTKDLGAYQNMEFPADN